MLKSLSAFAALAVLAATVALAEPQVSPPIAAQSEAAAPPPVDTMTCDQMLAEMTGAGRQMNSQLDPQFGVEAQAMAQEAQQKQRQAQSQAMGMGVMCAIPIVGMACMAGQQQQAAQAQQQTAANQQRMQAQMDRLDASMAGIDQNRMMAMSNRFEAQHCQSPMQQSGQMPR